MWDKRVRLTLRWMFEAAVGDRTQKLAFQQEIAETSRMNADVATLLVRATAGDSQIALLIRITVGGSGGRSSRGGGGSLKLLIGVVDEIFFVRHGDGRR